MVVKEIDMSLKRVKDKNGKDFHFERNCPRGLVKERDINLKDVNCMSDMTHIIGVGKEHFYISNKSYHQLKSEMKKSKLLETLSLERI
jgi:hypothetical protein